MKLLRRICEVMIKCKIGCEMNLKNIQICFIAVDVEEMGAHLEVEKYWIRMLWHSQFRLFMGNVLRHITQEMIYGAMIEFMQIHFRIN